VNGLLTSQLERLETEKMEPVEWMELQMQMEDGNGSRDRNRNRAAGGEAETSMKFYLAQNLAPLII